ncbi:heterokaryon incompatibility protein-domain-containing protein [Paraphoma chrysanthemicola]|uniref:Heterokaryon incompatibility protein-domain-containing protein n=1 Tax=Paraphoma chrysanthemicola TaxID=798071 RepID=A0A8K0W163_9PLEO|nr:heterokaryon incompatibility protein-domain-containing protein [Paraphoma chrysanthemicola]
MYSYLHMILHGAGDGEKVWYWIDSLCIDQDNMAERNAQIKIMGQIYRTAAQCDVWLGEEAEESWRAFRFLRFLDRKFHGSSSWPSVDWIEKILAPRTGNYRDDWNAVEKLFARPWWTRVWTVQEFILSKNVVFRCGTLEMPRSLFRNAIHVIWECRSNKLKSDGPWNRIRLHEWYAMFGEDEDTKSQGASLTATLAYLGNHQATDPRDRIYSLCSLAKDPEIAGTPDYNQTVETVYIDLVRSFIKVHKSLDIICFSSIFRDTNHTFTSLPSWVPDWRVTQNVLVGPLMVSQGTKSAIGNLRALHSLECTAIYSASLCVEPKVRFSPDLRKMTCRGIFLDRIDGLAGLPIIPWAECSRKADEMTQPTSPSSASKDPSRYVTSGTACDILMDVMRCLVLNREDHYFNHVFSDDDCLKQSASLLSRAANRDPSPHSAFRAWYAANRELCIHGWRLEDLTKKFLKAVDLKGDVRDLRLDSRVHDTLVKMKRRFIITNDGHLGMASSDARKGDFVGIMYGCSVPVVLRWSAEKEAFSFIGECYLHGFMNGKALTRHYDSRKREFGII